MINNANLPVIPAKRYFSLDEAAVLAQLDIGQIQQWQQQEGVVLGKGTQVLTRNDVIKLRQMRHSISDYFARNALDEQGNPVISAIEMRAKLETMLLKIDNILAVKAE
ncbi:hypothetical protein ACKLNO_00450 [Neisseriaceae bacterium B1]